MNEMLVLEKYINFKLVEKKEYGDSMEEFLEACKEGKNWRDVDQYTRDIKIKF